MSYDVFIEMIGYACMLCVSVYLSGLQISRFNDYT
jgi:hypothetical protein